ncbi:MAG: hypothetical protein RIM84_01855 [Alphaproteobacteria bacterium]
MSGHGHKIPPGETPRWLDERRNVDKIYYGLIVLCVGSVAADLFYEKHGHYQIEHLIGAYGIYGFLACVGLVLAAKELRKLIMRDENYYDDDADDGC